jgi:thioredoxin reductase (NADPH)
MKPWLCTETARAAALFVMIDALPSPDWLPSAVLRDGDGYILTGQDLLTDGSVPAGWLRRRPPFPRETSLPGVFAVGDVGHDATRRVASAVGDGAIAIQMAHEYLKERSVSLTEADLAGAIGFAPAVDLPSQ